MLDELIFAARSWWSLLLAVVGTIHTEALVLSIIWASIVGLISLIWASRRGRKIRKLRAEASAMRADLDDLRAKYAREVEWRMAAERHDLKTLTSKDSS